MKDSQQTATETRMKRSAIAVEEAADVVERAATRVESNVVEGIQPDITEMRMYISELSESADIRQKRLTWAVWALALINLITLLVVLLRG
jgi:hypothetical protein